MASVSDTTVTSGRPRPAGTGIVLAGDRTNLRARARRHSVQVKLLKYALPLSTIAIFGLYGLSVLQTTGWGTSFGELKVPQIIPENIAMENPHYEGYFLYGDQKPHCWSGPVTPAQRLKEMAMHGMRHMPAGTTTPRGKY